MYHVYFLGSAEHKCHEYISSHATFREAYQAKERIAEAKQQDGWWYTVEYSA